MPDPVVVTDEIVTDEVLTEDDEAKAAAEFDSGFTGKPIEAPKDVAVDAEKETVVAEKTPEVKYVQITEADFAEFKSLSTQMAEFKADNTKALDKVFGKQGGLERTLATMQAATPTGFAVDVTDDVVADLQTSFPELGGLTLKAFKSFASKLKGTGAAADPEAVSKAVTSGLVALQIEALEEDFPDWRATVGPVGEDNPYRKWLATQPADYQKRLSTTNSASVIGKSLTKFAEVNAAAQAATDKAAAEKAAADKVAADKAAAAAARQKRLDGAVVSRGAGGNVAGGKSDQEEFEAGFRGD